MKRFRVIITSAQTGLDIYGNFFFEAESFGDLVRKLTEDGVSFRVVEQLSPAVIGVGMDRFFPLTPWESIPREALLPIDTNGGSL